MPEKFIERLMSYYQRDPVAFGDHAGSLTTAEFMQKYIVGVRDSPYRTYKQKISMLGAFSYYGMAERIWENPSFAEHRIETLSGRDIPEGESAEEIVPNITRQYRTRRLEPTLRVFERPIHREEAAGILAREFGLDERTILRDISFLERIGYIELLATGRSVLGFKGFGLLISTWGA